MPVKIERKAKPKKKGVLSRLVRASRSIPGDFLRGAEDAATGFPTGVVALAHALDQALPSSPIPGIDEGHRQSYKPIKKIGSQIVKQTKEDLRHPLRDPFSTTLSLLGIASLGSGSALRAGSAVSKLKSTGSVKQAAKAAARPRPKTRKFKLANKATDKPRMIYGKPGTKPTRGFYFQPGKDVEVEANPNPLVRGARKITIDPLYRRSLKKADEDALLGKKSRGGAYARAISRRTEDQRTRYAENVRNARTPKDIDLAPNDPVKNVIRAPMDAMRLSMYTRPRYYIQNLGGTAQLMAHAGVSLGDVKAVRNIAKTDPELYKLMLAAGGETGVRAMANVTTGGGSLGRVSRRAAELANKPEANMRTMGIWKAAKDYGVTSPEELKAILRNPESDQAQLIMARGNESLVDYGRVGGSGPVGQAEKRFVQSGLPIFYPMMKGFTRYGARFPAQHPVQAAAMAQLGQAGKEIQREGIGGEPQPWFPYITPLPGGKTQNLQNIYTFSPGTDIARQTGQALPGASLRPTLNLLQMLGPAPEFAYGAASGRQLATGFEYDKDDLDWGGAIGAATKDLLQTVTPGMDLLAPRSSAAYGEPSLQDRLMLALVGPGLYPRKTDFGKIRQPKKKKPGRKRRRNSRF